MKHEFKMEITEEDFIAFYNNYIQRSILSKRNVTFYSAFLGFLLIVPIVTQQFHYLAYLGIFVVVIFILFFLMRRQGRRIYKNNTTAFNMTYTLTDNEITFKTEEGSSSKFWSEFFSIVEQEHYIFLYLKNKRGLIFCKRHMTEEGTAFLIEKSTVNMKEKNIKRFEK